MDCSPARTPRLLPLLALAFAFAFALDPAAAAPTWKDGTEKPGNGKGRNTAPEISGTPATVAEVDRFYAFQATATDQDGDALTFSITNKPSWAAFDSANGYLSGYPAESDAGTETTGIVVSVSDDRNTTSLPSFNIRVDAATNLPPVISGTPPDEVLAGNAYDFFPTAEDPEGEPLSFGIANRPAWASFDTTNGRLHGTPGSADAGVYENVRITASDGASSTSMPTFSVAVVETTTGSVTLNWHPPTENVDGTPLQDLAGYKIYYGTAARQYDHSLEIDNPGVTSAVIGNLSLGTWYFVATATTAAGLESDPSAEVTRVID